MSGQDKAEQIGEILKKQARPYLHSHGGDIRIAGIEGDTVAVELIGGCAGCPSADYETRSFIENVLQKEYSPEAKVDIIHPVDQKLLSFARRLLKGEGRECTPKEQ